MPEKLNQRWPRAVFACVVCGCAFAGGLMLNQSPAGSAIASGVLLGIVALIPAGLLLMFERMNYRLSLRAMLIATTVVAVGVVVAAWVLRK